MSSAMYVVAFSGEPPVELVLRCYVRADLNREEPDLAVRESAALRAASAAEIPTPELVAVDPMGERVGVPALLMTRLAGRVVWDPTGVDGWLQRLAEVLSAVHAVESGHEPVGVYENYAQESYAPPKWATKTAIWERAAEVFHGPILDEGRCSSTATTTPGTSCGSAAMSPVLSTGNRRVSVRRRSTSATVEPTSWAMPPSLPTGSPASPRRHSVRSSILGLTSPR